MDGSNTQKAEKGLDLSNDYLTHYTYLELLLVFLSMHTFCRRPTNLLLLSSHFAVAVVLLKTIVCQLLLQGFSRQAPRAVRVCQILLRVRYVESGQVRPL